MLQTDEKVMQQTSVKGKAVSVIGAARSGVAVARLLARQGATVFVSDAGAAANLREPLDALRALEAACETGGHTDRVLEADLIVVSPGVPSTIPILREAERRNIRVVGELELASWFCPAPIIGVTGTNGKTTTTTLIGRMLHDAKRKHAVGGNIGNAFSAMLDDLDEQSIAVLEVSSFQLDHIESFRPSVAVLLNITPDHLDRYDHRVEKYIAAKCRIFENQTTDDTLIYNDDDPETREQVRRLASHHVRALPFSLERRVGEGAFVEGGMLVTVVRGVRSEILPVGEISIRGTHNLYNSMAAALAARTFGVGAPSLRATLRNFRGVEHRLEFVRELRGIQYVNDSKATNVDAVWYALQAFKEPIVLFLGGRDKGNDYTRLVELVRSNVRAIVAIGESAELVVAAFEGVKPVVTASSMEEAVTRAAGLARAGDIVLLSPACASFDWFRNYEHRGEVFKQLVHGLA